MQLLILRNNMLLNLLLICLMVVGDSCQTKTMRTIVIDAETRARIREATVTIDGKEKAKTSWDGSFIFEGNGSRITISKRGYLQRILNVEELTDTIELINDGKFLDEVVVIGHYRTPSINFRTISSEATKNVPRQSGVGFDMNDILDHLINHNKYKRRKKAKKVLKDY